jgi:hypothetical protein
MADARPEADRGTAFWNLRERMSETPSSLRYSPDHTWVDTDSNSGLVQLAPTGSTCSIQFRLGLSDARPGSTQMTYLIVSDVQAAHGELARRGIDVGAIRHKSAVDDWQSRWMEGVHPIRRGYASVFDVVDPDGKTWLVQEIGFAERIDSSKAVRRRAATVRPEKG